MTGDLELNRPWHALAPEAALAALASGPAGLSEDEARERLARFGPNEVPARPRRSAFAVYLSQFKSPLIYLLLAATALSLAIGEFADAGFIFVVLQINAMIGGVQEWKAETSAAELDRHVRSRAVVIRDGRRRVVDGAEIVPGDVIELESGSLVPADMRLLAAHELLADESLLTGESVPAEKRAEPILDPETALADRRNLLHAGTTVLAGRARGVAVRTGAESEVGRIAAALAVIDVPPPPLLARLARFSRLLGAVIVGAIAVLAAAEIARGVPVAEILLVGVALAVSAIPEGLPVAITIALAIASARMARRKVVVRQLPAVEGLGACTLIASDKTGTLTCNELTVKRLFVPDAGEFEVSGEGYNLEGAVVPVGAAGAEGEAAARRRAAALAEAGALCNEASIYPRDDGLVHVGDTVDVALLVLAGKLGIEPMSLSARYPRTGIIPFEPERRFAATFHRAGDGIRAFVKGAAETVIPMCGRAAAGALAEAERLAAQGFRVLALAAGPVPDEARSADALKGLTLLGLVGIIDPLRPEAGPAVARCREAGIDVRMITGDHPATAREIARQLGIATGPVEVITGAELARLASRRAEYDARVARAHVFARVEPTQKLDIVESLRRAGHFVAVTGDGVNDAPALRAADIGVAMGRSGTDVARAAADLILADDNFASIVAGIEEGRAAYANVRKLVYLLISTGAAEVVLFFLALFAGLPLPLAAVQLLWLNLVTNGIQDVALAFEKGEPGILAAPPRPPREPLIDRRMIEQIALSGAFMGGMSFVYFQWLLGQGVAEDAARNLLLLMLVLFENAHVFNCRSETRSAFRVPFAANPFLVLSVIGAQGVHIAAMHLPGLGTVLGVSPVSLEQWAIAAAMAASLIVVMETYKRIRAAREPPKQKK